MDHVVLSDVDEVAIIEMFCGAGGGTAKELFERLIGYVEMHESTVQTNKTRVIPSEVELQCSEGQL